MTSPFLTTTECQTYEQVPLEISSYDLLTYFQFSDQDRELISLQRRPANRLGFALQLALVRYMGFTSNGCTRFPLPSLSLSVIN